MCSIEKAFAGVHITSGAICVSCLETLRLKVLSQNVGGYGNPTTLQPFKPQPQYPTQNLHVPGVL